MPCAGPAPCQRAPSAPRGCMAKSQRITTMINSILRSSGGDVQVGAEENEAFLALKDFMYRTVYVDRSAKKEEQKVEKVLTELYEYYLTHIEQMSNFYLQLAYQEGRDRAVTDYISGMSDEFAIRTFDPDSQRSVDNMEEIVVYPAAELVLTREQKSAGLDRIVKEGKKITERSERR